MRKKIFLRSKNRQTTARLCCFFRVAAGRLQMYRAAELRSRKNGPSLEEPLEFMMKNIF